MTDIGLGCNRLAGESWRESVERIARKHGLVSECLEIFDEETARGVEAGKAAWTALYDWDCLDLVENHDT